jgi:radical SAM protein with 4Fe4S-binding SPASM domain
VENLERYRKKIEGVSLCGIGEPFMHKSFWEDLSFLRKSFVDMKLEIITNGVLLDEGKIINLLRFSISKISVSLDAFNEKSYYELKGENYFHKVVDNIAVLLREATHLNTIVQINVLYNGSNNKDIEDCLVYFNQHLSPKDAVYVRRVKSLGGQVAVHVTKDDVVRMFEQIRNKDNDVSKLLIDKASYHNSQRLPCHQINFFVMILQNGDVVPCCIDFNGGMAMGNVKEKNLYDIWFSPAYVKFRKDMKQLDFGEYPLCRNCEEWEMGLY